MIYSTEDKAIIEQSLTETVKRLLLEQDVYRDIHAGPCLEKDTATENLLEMGWQGLVKTLEGQYLPIDDKFKSLVLVNGKDCKTATEKRIDLIEDTDIRGGVQFMNRYAVHTKLIQVGSTLYHLFGSVDGYPNIFGGWRLYSQCKLLNEEIPDKSELILVEKTGKAKLDVFQQYGQLLVEATIESLDQSNQESDVDHLNTPTMDC